MNPIKVATTGGLLALAATGDYAIATSLFGGMPLNINP